MNSFFVRPPLLSCDHKVLLVCGGWCGGGGGVRAVTQIHVPRPDVTKCSVKLQQPAARSTALQSPLQGSRSAPGPAAAARHSPVSPQLAADTLGPTSNKETEVSSHLCSPASGQLELSTKFREILQ